MAKFNAKTFNPEAFAKYMERVPQTRKNELIKSRALRGNSQIRDVFKNQTGTFFATIPMYGTLEGAPVNYDGATDITAESTVTYDRGVIVIGRAKGFVEGDFAEDITGGAGFMDNVANQLGEFWDGVNQDMLLSILKGIFAMTGAKNLEFVNGHTYDITLDGVEAPVSTLVTASTLNTAIQKASGDKKSIFKISIMHSAIATNLENLKLLKYMTYTDAAGIERQLELATWNGRVVLIDDNMPTADVTVPAVYALTTDVALDAGKTYYTRSGSAGSYVYTAVASPVVENIATYYELTAASYAYTEYTTFVLGDGAFDYEDLGVEVPFEMSRDAAKNGGQTTLYTRQRKCMAPKGISFTKASVASLSPTNAELEMAANWSLVNDGNAVAPNRKYYDHKQIPIARIISRG